MASLQRSLKRLDRSASAAIPPLRRLHSRLSGVRKIALREARDLHRTPWRVKLATWRRGFLSLNHQIYRFEENDPADYLPDFAHFLRAQDINGPYRFLLDDKLAFFVALSGFTSRLPRHFGLIRNGAFQPLDSAWRAARPGDFEEVLTKEGHAVFKRIVGAGGRGLAFVEVEDGAIRWQGEIVDSAGLAARVGALDGFIVCERARSHPDLAAISPDTVNTLRVITMWDDETGAPFVARAVQRLGTKATAPVDHWAKGGLGARVDLETGILDTGWMRFHGSFDTHPETGARIRGLPLPHWDLMVRELLALCEALPMLLYVSWDIIITPDGFLILEGNNHGSLPLVQIAGGLLRDPRVRRFYRRHGVI